MDNKKTNTATDRLEKVLEPKDQREIKLTKRGKIALTLGAMALVGGIATGYATGAAPEQEPRSTISVTLEQGSTVWDVMDLIPGVQSVDKRDVYDEVKALNPNIDFSKPILAGTQIKLPSEVG